MFLFWSLVFPLALMTAMYVTCGDVYDMINSIDPHKTAIVFEDDSEFTAGFEEVIRSMADESSEEHYFDLQEDLTREEAEEKIKASAKPAPKPAPAAPAQAKPAAPAQPAENNVKGENG